MKKIIKSIIFEYNLICNSVRFWRAKRKANKLHKLTGRRYHVIPTETKLVVVDNTFIDRYNKLVKKSGQKMTIEKLLQISYYSTSVQGIIRNN